MYGLSDFHCDTLTRLSKVGEGLYENSGQLDLRRLKIFEAPLLTFAVCLDGKGEKCFEETAEYIRHLRYMIEDYPEPAKPGIIKSYDDIDANTKDGLTSIILAIEGGEALEGSLENLEKFYELGVRLLTLTWNKENELGGGALAESSIGLTPFGRRVAAKLPQMGMITDVSHLNDKGFWELAEVSGYSFVASHSNCRAVCGNKRNLTDGQIKEIGRRNGLVGLNLFPEFICDSGKASLSDLIPHAERILEKAGEDCLCLGSDFDGVSSLPDGVGDVGGFMRLRELFAARYGEKIAEKIICTNLRRYLKDFNS